MSRSRPSDSARGVLILASAMVLVSGCSGDGGYSDFFDGPAAPGGEGTVIDKGVGAFSQPAANLSDADRALFRVGDSFFTEPWTPAGEGHEDRDGLGPTFLATSCAGCHVGDGRGAPPLADGAPGTPIVRFSDTRGRGVVLENYGVQLQSRAIHAVPVEAMVEFEWVIENGTYSDGAEFTLRRPVAIVEQLAFGALPSPVSGVRLAPGLIGLGLLEAIPESVLRANADAGDVDGDGISGVASEVTVDGEQVLGRFGLKANVATVAEQVATAYLLDIGITSPRFPTENCPAAQDACHQASSGGSPEISAERLAAVVSYAQTLGVPARVGLEDESVLAGERIFDGLGCATCHTTKWETGAHDIEALSYQAIYPYTDLLLHDMGEGLSDGRSDGTASPREWRTAPLWGSGLVRTVNPNAGFLHDGRARTLEEAILWHGGEGGASRDRFVRLPAADRTVLLLFVKSL